MNEQARARVWRRWRREDALALGLVAAFACALFWLGTGPFMVGPSDWDDTMYVDTAASGEYRWHVRNRYVHIWALRVVQELIEPRRTAAAVWPALLAAALAVTGFLAGRRCGGTGCGLLAMVLVAMFPPMLKYVGVPHVDLTLALFGMVAVLAAVAAVQDESLVRSRAAAIGCGLSCFLALETKETALILPPLAVYLLSGATRPKLHVYGEWLAGLVLGWCALTALDALYTIPGHTWSSDVRGYFPSLALPAEAASGSGSGGAAASNLERELLGELSGPSYVAFVWTGLAGAAHGFRRSPWIKALALWGLGTLVFTALIAARSQNIDGQDRYLIGIGIALAPLSAAWVTTLWRRPREGARDNLAWLAPLLLLVSGLALWSLWSVHFGPAGRLAQRTAFFVVPVAMLLLLLTPWLSGGSVLPAAAALLLLAISSFLSIAQARAHVTRERHEIAPWLAVVSAADAAGTQIAVWKPGKKIGHQRVRWRVRALSSRPLAQLEVRSLSDPAQARAGEWLFTGAERSEALDRAGWQRVASVKSRRPWSVYRPPH